MSEKHTTYKICPECSYFCSTNEDNNYCPFCGEGLINKCPNCDEKINTPYASFCSKCGTKYPGRNKKNQNKYTLKN